MSNKDLLKLENEYRNDLPKYKEKPHITRLPKPNLLTEKISEFLTLGQTESTDKPIINVNRIAQNKSNKQVEMDIYICPMEEGE